MTIYNSTVHRAGKLFVIYHSNKLLVDFWHEALHENGLSVNYIQLLNMNRKETQAFLKNPLIYASPAPVQPF